MKQIILILIMCLGVAPFLFAQATLPGPGADCEMKTEEISVYQAAIAHMLRDQEPVEYFLQEETSSFRPNRGLESALPKLWQAYEAANKQKCRLRLTLVWRGSDFTLQRAKFVKPEPIRRLGDSPRRLWPSITVSRVGFEPGGTRAALYCGSNRGPMNGRGSFFILEKVDGKWRVFKTHPFLFS